jgi:S-formylglutathione hydrolase FrmB
LLAVLLAGFTYSINIAPISHPPPWDGTVWNNPTGIPSTVTHGSYYSNIMGVQVGYNIYLPPQYASQSTARFPVIYFFAGSGGNENSDPPNMVPPLVGLINAGTVQPTIMVFANGGIESWYMDAYPGSLAYGSYRVDSTIINELIPYIDGNYRTNATAGQRAIQGMSMGGEGCNRFAFKYPTLFSSAYCYAPAIDDLGQPECGHPESVLSNEPAAMANMFNTQSLPAGDPSHWYAYSVWGLINSNTANIIAANLPHHVIAGDQDSLTPFSQCLDTQMTSLGIPHDSLQIVAGCGHDEVCLGNAVNWAGYTFAASHFH